MLLQLQPFLLQCCQSLLGVLLDAAGTVASAEVSQLGLKVGLMCFELETADLIPTLESNHLVGIVLEALVTSGRGLLEKARDWNGGMTIEALNAIALSEVHGL